MAYCTKCGTQVAGAQFCPKCGAAVSSAAGTVPPPVQPVTHPGLSTNLASALCYLFGIITGVIFLILAPYNRDRQVRFHAFQSILLSLASLVVEGGISIVSRMFRTISFTLGTLIGSLNLLVSLGFFLVWLYVMWKSYQGEKVMLPIIGPIAEQQANAGASNDSSSGTMGRAA